MITSNYTGVELVLFGSVERDAAAAGRRAPYDIVATITGPREPLRTRRKQRVLGIWVNVASRTFVDPPSYLAVLTSRPLDAITSAENARRLQLGIANTPFPELINNDIGEVSNDPFRAALVRLMRERGLYSEQSNAVTFLTPTLFRAAISLPAQVPIGSYMVDVKLFADGNVIAQTDSAFEIVKVGFEQFVVNAAREHGLLYGLATAMMALVHRLDRQRCVPARLISIRQAALRGDGKKPLRAQHVRGEGKRAEQAGDRAVAHVEAAGIGAECRHDQPAPVAGKAAPAHRAAALRHARQRMQMAGDLAVAGIGRRLVAKHQRAERQNVGETAADAVGEIGIVIAGDPDPVAAALEQGERRTIAAAHARRSMIVMKAVAQRDDKTRRIALDQARQPRQRRRRIVRRQQHAALGEGRAFFQMQIGDDKQSFVRPVQRAGRIGDERRTGESDRGILLRIPAGAGMSGRSATPHCIASFTNSSAASPRSESAASP